MTTDYSKYLETVHPLDDKQGTKLLQGTRQYHFLRNAAGAYVAEVIDDHDREAILSISQGYRYYQPTAEQRRMLARAAVGAEGVDNGSISAAQQAQDQSNAAIAKSEQATAKVVRPAKAQSKPAAKKPASIMAPPTSTGRKVETDKVE